MEAKTISKHLFSYYYAGVWWSLDIPAYSKADALEIVNKLPLAKFDGVVYYELKFAPCFVVKLYNKLKSLLKDKQ
jgi:hypothetical protein